MNDMTDKKRIVLYDAPGQMCNRFWAYLDSVAWAMVNGRKVVIWHWDPNLCCFDALRNSEYVSFPFYSKRIISIVGEARWQEFLHLLLRNRMVASFCRSNTAKRLGITASWPLRKSFEYYPGVKDRLIPLFRPNEELCRPVEETMGKYRSEGRFVIGVHIRRGDYKNWLEGKYYYELEDYLATMQSLKELYKDRKVSFFISTNEKLDSSVFPGLEICRFNNTAAAQDLYTLSLCDRIIGPLSTFSRWASWYGSVPLAFIGKGQTDLCDEDFSVIHDFYHFENGNEIVNLSDR